MVEADLYDKVMTASEAVKKFVNNGDEVSIGNFLHSSPNALIHEVIRQKKRDLTVYIQSGIEELDLLVGAGCAKRILTAYNFRAGGERLQTELERGVREERIELEDYSNYSLLAMLQAGAMGYTFMQVLPSLMHTDIFRVRGFMGEKKFKAIDCPFTGKKVLLVPAANPDVAITHVQRVDKYGNAQLWGSIGNSKWANLACKRIVVSAEEIVDHEIVNSSPHFTIIPSFRVDAVVQEPWGAHPSEILGHYSMDLRFRSMFFSMENTAKGLQQFLDEWVYRIEDRKRYIEHYIERFGRDPLEKLRAIPYPSATADYGSNLERHWDERGFHIQFQITRKEYEELLVKKVKLFD